MLSDQFPQLTLCAYEFLLAVDGDTIEGRALLESVMAARCALYRGSDNNPFKTHL